MEKDLCGWGDGIQTPVSPTVIENINFCCDLILKNPGILMEVIIQPPGASLKERRKLQCHILLQTGKLLYLPWVPLILLISRVTLFSQMWAHCLIHSTNSHWGEVFLSFILNFILNRQLGGNPFKFFYTIHTF